MRDLAPTAGLDAVAEDLHFTVCRLQRYPSTAPLAKPIQGLVANCDSVDADHQKKLRRAIAKADADAVGCRGEVQTFATNLQIELLAVVKQNRRNPLFLLYFPKAPASALSAADHDKLRTWLCDAIAALAKDTTKALAGQHQQGVKVLADWDAAENARDAAQGANRQHGTGVRDPLRGTVNTARRDLHADLVKIGNQEGRGKHWAATFFRAVKRDRGEPAL